MPDLEPWLRGILPDVAPVNGHLLRAAEQICEDSAAALETLTAEQLWSRPKGMTSAGFHAKHLAGSTERLCTYLEGRQLDKTALEAMKTEREGRESPQELIQSIRTAFQRYAAIMRNLPPAQFGAIRAVGRQRIEVTAIGLAIHIAEHGQRHTGQLISAARLARA